MFVRIIILVAARQLESLFQIHQAPRRVPLKQRIQRIQYIFVPLAFDFIKHGIRARRWDQMFDDRPIDAPSHLQG